MKRSLGVAALVVLTGLVGAASAQNIQRLPQTPASYLPPVTPQAPAAPYLTAYRTAYETYFADGPPPAPVADSTGPSLATESSVNTAPAATTTTPATPRPESRTSSFSAWAGNEQALEETGWSEGCDSCDGCGAPCDYGWFASAGAVVLTRTRGPADVLSYVSGSGGTPALTTQAANAGWTGGGEVTLGYAFEGLANNCGPWGACSASSGAAIAFTWWGTGEMNGFGNVSDFSGGTTFDTAWDFPTLTVNGNPFSFYFEDAAAQRISRSDIVNSAEINLLTGTLISSERFQVTALAGFRYFRVWEDLAFSSLTNGATNWDNPDDYATERFRCLNNLYGAQLGSVVNFNFSPEWSLFFVPKAGVYCNQMTVNSRIYSNGDTGFGFTDEKSDVAFLGQIDTGLNWHFRSNAYGYLGYRIVGVSNVALGDAQFAPSIGDVKQGSSLILHGAFLGLGWLF